MFEVSVAGERGWACSHISACRLSSGAEEIGCRGSEEPASPLANASSYISFASSFSLTTDASAINDNFQPHYTPAQDSSTGETARPAHTVRFWPYHFSSSLVGVAHFPSCVVQAMVTNDLAFVTQLRIQCRRGRAVGRDPERQWWVCLIKRF